MMRRRMPFLAATALACVLACALMAGAAYAMPSEHPFEIVPGSFGFAPSSLQAGAHADWVTSFEFAHEENGSFNDARNILVNLPAGFAASDTAVPTCTLGQMLGQNREAIRLSECPVGSQVGQLQILSDPLPEVHNLLYTTPIYNMEVTSPGVTAELGYRTATYLGFLRIQVRPQDLGLTSATVDVPQAAGLKAVRVTIWGVPAASEHDPERGVICVHYPTNTSSGCEQQFGGPKAAGIPAKPLLSNPTRCGMFEAQLAADSWEEPFGENIEPFTSDLSEWPKATDRVGPITGCERLPFEPAIAVQPSTRAAEAPSGLEVSLQVPQSWDASNVLSTAYVKDTTVTLPEGMTANPGLAEGLGACTPQQYAAERASSLPGEGCPPESKIGTVEIETPLLGEKIDGAVYIATPYDNPFGEPGHPHGSLLALYLVAKDRERGLLIKVAGKIAPDPVTGRLTTTFENTPQQPFGEFKLKFRPGAAAPLITPPACGTYVTEGSLTPWSAPAPVPVADSFAITEGVGGGACPAGGAPPFKPEVVSGTENNAGGSYSSFYLHLSRRDGEQEFVKFSTTLPPGLTGNLTGVAKCPDSAIEAAKEKSGAEEQESPSCPPTSEIGHTLVGAGVGTVLAQNPGKVYLAGPYHGAPLSVVSITAAKVGPFDLGTVVIRFALNINPTTGQVEISGAQSDPIPDIIRGIVVHVRDIRVYIDRPGFMINPTNCEKLGIANAVTGSGSNRANPASEDTVNVATSFRAADCSSLGFAPKFTASASGKTSRLDGASLSVKLDYPSAPQGSQANIRQVKVELPRQLPSRLPTLQKACTKAQFDANPAGCPAASIVGHAKAITPILPVPLEGPAYFVSNGGEAWPNLIIVLQGYGFTIDLVGDTLISKQGVTSSTFEAVPDEPVTSFELTLPEGPYSALTALGNLCRPTKTVLVKKRIAVTVHGRRRIVTRKVKQTKRATIAMPSEFVAQNGATIHRDTPVAVTQCPAAKAARKNKHAAKAAKHRRAIVRGKAAEHGGHSRLG